VRTSSTICCRNSGGYAGLVLAIMDSFLLRDQVSTKSGQLQYNLGNLYARGDGVPEDDAEAIRLYRLAAEQGYARAQSNLGAMYSLGDGVPQDDREAVRWWRLAAEQGEAAAQSNLGLMCSNGEGVPEDDVLAYMWYNLAAAQGHASVGLVVVPGV
jgi:TPR repeat protein